MKAPHLFFFYNESDRVGLCFQLGSQQSQEHQQNLDQAAAFIGRHLVSQIIWYKIYTILAIIQLFSWLSHHISPEQNQLMVS